LPSSSLAHKAQIGFLILPLPFDPCRGPGRVPSHGHIQVAAGLVRVGPGFLTLTVGYSHDAQADEVQPAGAENQGFAGAPDTRSGTVDLNGVPHLRNPFKIKASRGPKRGNLAAAKRLADWAASTAFGAALAPGFFHLGARSVQFALDLV